MQDSMTIAEVGSIVKVSGRRIATPLGPPRPGNTPTKMPRTSPTIISARIFHVRRTLKPYIRRPKASMAPSLVAEQRLERSLRHDDVERDVESRVHGCREHQRGQHRFPCGDAPDELHESSHEQETCDVQPEPLHQHAKQQRRNEHLRDTPELLSSDEGFARVLARQNLLYEAVQAGGGKDYGKIEREIAGLRAGGVPRHAGAPVIECEKCGERQQQHRDGKVDGPGRAQRRRIARRRPRVLDDDLDFSLRHYFATKPASVIRFLLRAPSSSRNFSMSFPVRKIGLSACFSMYSLYSAVWVTFL